MLTNGVWPANGTNVSYDAGGCVSIPNTGGAAIVLDLGSIKTINNIYISMSDNDSEVGAGFSFSNDNVTFNNSTTLLNPGPSTDSSQFRTLTLTPAVTARYVRLTNVRGGYQPADKFCQLAVGP